MKNMMLGYELFEADSHIEMIIKIIEEKGYESFMEI